MRSPAYATADEWADNCRTFPASAPLPGPWKTELVPYTRAIMRAFTDAATDVVVAVMGAQMSKTECQLNVLGHMWDTHPRPSLYVTPTEKLARTMSRDRISHMLRTSSNLQQKVDKRYDKPGSLERWIAGARFGLAWAGSPTELASHPCALVMVDERSRMEADVGGEGDPVRLAMARTKNYPGSKVGVFSTPTTEGTCATYQWWLTGTKMRWCWRCPECGNWLVPCIEHARYPQAADYADIRVETWIECPDCKHKIREDDKAGLESDYVPSTVDSDGSVNLSPGLEVRNPVASYWVTGFASPFTTIGEVMEQYARAARDGSPGDLQAIVNTYCGELWKQPGESVPADRVRACQREGIPESIQMVTAGVDVQKESLYYVIRGWAPNSESYLLDHGQLHGATEYDDVWIQLARSLDQTFTGLAVRMTLVDSGYNTAQVYEACRRNGWAPSKGQARASSDRPFYDSLVDESPAGRARRNVKLWNFSTDTWKTWLYARIQWPDDRPGGWYVPTGIDDDYCGQVVNERVRVERGKRVWYPTGSMRNHYLDCEVMAAVAAHIQGVRTLRAKPKVQPQQNTPEPPRPPRRGPSPLDRRGI